MTKPTLHQDSEALSKPMSYMSETARRRAAQGRRIVHSSTAMLAAEADYFQCEVIAIRRRALGECGPEWAWVARWCDELLERWAVVQRLVKRICEPAVVALHGLMRPRPEPPELEGPVVGGVPLLPCPVGPR